MFQKTYRLRLLLLGLFSLLAFAVIEVRLFYVQVPSHQYYTTRAQRQQHRTFYLTPRRGDIVDRNGDALATSFSSDRIVLDTRKVSPPPDGLVEDLRQALELPPEKVQAWFDQPGRRVAFPLPGIPYSRKPEDVSLAIGQIQGNYKLPSDFVVCERVSKRVYPNAALAAHILGYTTSDDAGDNIGLEGLEKQYDKTLKGSYQEQELPVSGVKKGLTPLPDNILLSTYGNTLVLTLDRQIQMFAESQLQAAVNQYTAVGGIALVMDVTTGGILAMASCPSYDPNQFSSAPPEARRNRVLTDPIEVGSVMKIITATLLIDKGLLSPTEMVDCHGGRAMIEGRSKPIVDSHVLGVVPYSEAFAESSNIAHALLAYRMEPRVYYEGLCRFGLGQYTGVDLPGENLGILHPLDKWTGISRAQLAYGYESGLTPVQVISALGAIANNGKRLRPHLVSEIRTVKGELIQAIEPEVIEQVASAETCATIRGLMGLVVEEGTGTSAKIPGYKVGGKTGTTVKNLGRDNPKKYYASFAGLMPIDNPRLAIYVYIDEPHGAKYGGTVAAPVFCAIAKGAAHILRIPPSDPEAYEQELAKEAAASTTTQTAAAAPLPEEEDSAATAPTPVAQADTASTDSQLVRMPDCKGMTMVEAWNKLAQSGIKGNMLGSGVVVRQEPPPGSGVRGGQEATIIFALPSETEVKAGAAH